MSTTVQFTVEQFDQMIAAGFFDGRDDRRIELIYGEIQEMPLPGPEHEVMVDRLTEWSFENLPKRRVWIRVQQSLGLAELASVPLPDIAWVARRDYSDARPTPGDVLLVIEVAETTLSRDRRVKMGLYAQAGIAEYWVVNLRDRTIEVYRDPGPDQYRSLQTYSGPQELRPLAAAEVVLRPAQLWPEERP